MDAVQVRLCRPMILNWCDMLFPKLARNSLVWLIENRKRIPCHHATNLNSCIIFFSGNFQQIYQRCCIFIHLPCTHFTVDLRRNLKWELKWPIAKRWSKCLPAEFSKNGNYYSSTCARDVHRLITYQTNKCFLFSTGKMWTMRNSNCVKSMPCLIAHR